MKRTEEEIKPRRSRKTREITEEKKRRRIIRSKAHEKEEERESQKRKQMLGKKMCKNKMESEIKGEKK